MCLQCCVLFRKIENCYMCIYRLVFGEVFLLVLSRSWVYLGGCLLNIMYSCKRVATQAKFFLWWDALYVRTGCYLA